MSDPFVTVIETPTFIRRSASLMTGTDRQALIDHLAANPTDGQELGSGVRNSVGQFTAGAREAAFG